MYSCKLEKSAFILPDTEKIMSFLRVHQVCLKRHFVSAPSRRKISLYYIWNGIMKRLRMQNKKPLTSTYLCDKCKLLATPKILNI